MKFEFKRVPRTEITIIECRGDSTQEDSSLVLSNEELLDLTMKCQEVINQIDKENRTKVQIGQ